MQEWLNWHAWKACEPLKGSAGSNPALSASKEPVKTGFCFYKTLSPSEYFFQCKSVLIREIRVSAKNAFLCIRIK